MLLANSGRQAVAEFLQERVLVLSLAQPVVAIDLEQRVGVSCRQAQVTRADHLGGGHDANRRFTTITGAVAGADLIAHPAQDAHIFAESRPDIPPLVISSEPV